jgi:hypothetical protein
MAWHSSAGFTLFVTDDEPKLTILLNESHAQWANYLVLAAKVEEYEACLLAGDVTNRFWQCSASNHSWSMLGHVSEIDKIEARQRKVSRKIDRLTRRIVRIMKQQPWL